MKFRVGQKFTVPRPRKPIPGVIVRVNQKSITVRASDGKMWRVPFSHLARLERGTSKPASSKSPKKGRTTRGSADKRRLKNGMDRATAEAKIKKVVASEMASPSGRYEVIKAQTPWSPLYGIIVYKGKVDPRGLSRATQKLRAAGIPLNLWFFDTGGGEYEE